MAELTGRTASTAKGAKTRRRIFDAAVAEFSENGYAGARIDRIADAAGVNKQRIYAYFGDKEGLFSEVWKRTSRLIMEEDEDLTGLGEEDIRALGPILLRRYMDFHEKHPEFWKIFVLENLMGSHHSREPMDHQPYGQLKSLYELGQEQGHYRNDVSFESFLYVLMAVTFFYASNWKTMSETLSLDLSSSAVKSRTFAEISRWLFTPDDRGKGPDQHREEGPNEQH